MFTASGKFESAPAVENMEIAAAAGSGGGGIAMMVWAVAQTANERRRVGASNFLDGKQIWMQFSLMRSKYW